MTDERWTDPPTDGELLSAYLADDLDAVEAADLEERLAAEPALRAQLDALADALVALSAADDAEVPDGFAERLDARLAEERDGVVSLERVRQRRARSAGWWTSVGTAAAVVAVGAVVAAGMLRSGGSDTGQELAQTAGDQMDADGADERFMAGTESAAEAPMADAPAAVSGGGADTTTDMAIEQTQEELSTLARPVSPLLLDEQAVIAGEGQLRRRYAGAPEIEGLLGVPIEEASTLATSFSAAVQRAPAFDSGPGPADCLETVTMATDAPLVPARVETLRYAGEDLLAYALVTASPESLALDRVEVWVVAPSDCATATVVFLQP